jgi:Protein of unknown function (DUF1064)
VSRWLPSRSQTKRRKYGNVKVGGFDSGKEAARFTELQLLVKAKEIIDLERQVRFELVPPHGRERGVYYVADFVYWQRNANRVWIRIIEDCKSEATRKNREYVIKRKLMNWRHGIRILET